MKRRSFLGLVGTGTLALAGCLTGADPDGAVETTRTDRSPTDGTGGGTPTGGTDGSPTPGNDETSTATDAPETDERPTDTSGLPEACPTTQGFDVEWPTDLDAGAAESFVEAYEHVYYRDVVVQYEPESSLDSYGLDGVVVGGPSARGDGWVVEYSGSGGVYRPTLLVGGRTADPPAGADVVSRDEIDHDALLEVLSEAAESGDAEQHLDRREVEMDDFLDRLASLSDDFDGLSEKGEEGVLYVDVDGTTVELTVTATAFHGDYWWRAWYYVDEQVVRRTAEEDADPRNGELLECRTLE